MNIKNMINFDRIKELILISNTSTYFYNNMVEEKTIREIGEKYSVSELFRVFKYYKEKFNNNIDTLIIIYCIIFSLTYKDYDSVEKFFDNIDSCDIRWSKDIKDIYFSRVKATTFINVHKNYSYKNLFSTDNHDPTNSILV